MRVYISGPITNNKNFKTNFKRAEQWLKLQGHEVINPVAVAEVLPTSLNYNHYMTIDAALLTTAEAIFLLEGWQDSPGAVEEYRLAAGTNKKVLFETQEEIKNGNN